MENSNKKLNLEDNSGEKFKTNSSLEEIVIDLGLDLGTHIKTVHEGVKNHKCDACGKSFSEAGTLKKHLRATHEGVKNHKCDTCGKAFSRAGHLKTHINSVHKGVRNHKCDQCFKLFTTAGNLKKHIKSVHKGKHSVKSESIGENENQNLINVKDVKVEIPEPNEEALRSEIEIKEEPLEL